MMKSKVLLAIAMALVSSPVWSADLPTKKAPPAAPAPAAFSWTGFYLGADVGYGWARDAGTEYLLATGARDGWAANSSPKGVFGGGFAGYNWQYGNFVLGVEGDLRAASIKGSGRYSFNGGAAITDHVDSNTNFEASARGRVGYAFDRFLVFGTGGVAFANTNRNYVTGFAGPPSTSFSGARTGWTLGAGLEYALTTNWTIRTEYRYSDFGTANNSPVVFAGGTRYVEKQRLTQSDLRFGVAYKF